MKKHNFLIISGLLVFLAGLARPACADQWNYTNNPTRFQIDLYYQSAHINAAVAKLEGTVRACSVSQNPQVAKQILAAIDYLSAALARFNTTLIEMYPTLSEEEQLAITEAYSSLGLYLEDLAAETNAETNSVFGKDIMVIIYEEPATRLPGQMWVGSGTVG